ncbi:hypothetical protein IHE44_0006221, partial [Lamprotornis superbus]
VECLLSLKWLSRLARRKTNSKMDQICQVCLISYLLHTPGAQLCPSRYNQQAGIRTMCLWSQLQFPHSRKYKFNCAYLKENEILQRITALRKEGLWSLKHLPKLHEGPQNNSHHDNLLEEMKWMATDFFSRKKMKDGSCKESKHADLSLFDVIGMENQITCYEAQVLPKLKVTGKLIEEICCSPSPPRLEPVKLKPNKGIPGEKRQLKEHLDKIYFWNEHHCSRTPPYGRDLLETCSWIKNLCVFPAVAVAPPCLYGANNSYRWTPGMKLLQFSLKEQRWCSKLGALAVLLWKLKAEGRAGAGFDTEDCSAQHPGAFPEFLFPHVSVSHTDVITVVFYDTDLDLLMDTKTKGWCDKIARSRDIHTYRLESGNSIEERLLKKSIKHMIQELAAQGGDCSTDFLSQVLAHVRGVVNSCNYVNHSPKQCKNRYIKTIADAEGKHECISRGPFPYQRLCDDL